MYFHILVGCLIRSFILMHEVIKGEPKLPLPLFPYNAIGVHMLRFFRKYWRNRFIKKPPETPSQEGVDRQDFAAFEDFKNAHNRLMDTRRKAREEFVRKWHDGQKV